MPMKTLTSKVHIIVSLIAQGWNHCQQVDTICLLLAKDDFVALNSESLSLQAALADYLNNIRYTLPQHKLLHSLSQFHCSQKNDVFLFLLKEHEQCFWTDQGKHIKL